MIGARERLFGPAGELGDGEIGFEFGCSFCTSGNTAKNQNFFHRKASSQINYINFIITILKR